MSFLYEATDANGKTVHGKVDGATLAEAQLKLLRQGLRPVTIAPIPESASVVSPASAPAVTPASLPVAAPLAPSRVSVPTSVPAPSPLLVRTVPASVPRTVLPPASGEADWDTPTGLAQGQAAPRKAGANGLLLQTAPEPAAWSSAPLPLPLPAPAPQAAAPPTSAALSANGFNAGAMVNGSVSGVGSHVGGGGSGVAANAASVPALNMSGGNLTVGANGSATLTRTGARTGGIVMAGNAAQVAAQTRTASVTQSRKTQTAPAIVRAKTRVLTPIPAGASKLGGVKSRDLMFFFRQLGALTHSGMTLYSALDNLAGRTRNPNLAKTAREMAESARTGGSVSSVMAHYPRIYPEHIIGMVRAGETGGFVEVALREIADVYEGNIALYRQAWIPKLMATQAFFIFALAQPLFPTLFPNAEFATYLKLVLLRNLPITFALYLLIRIASRALQLPQYRHLRDGAALRMQPFGPLQRLSALNTFLRVLSRLYAAGVGPGAAWEGAMNTASNVVIRDSLAEARDQMQGGASFADAFAATGLFGDSVESLIFTGQASGTVVESLEQAAHYYQAQLDEATGRARFMMLRLGVLAMLILGGGTLIYMFKTYFKSIFDFAEGFKD